MKTQITTAWKVISRHVAVSILAIAAVASLVTYHSVQPVAPPAAVGHPAAADRDDDAGGALLSPGRAMEPLAARVTPAIVNVTVASRRNPDVADQQLPDGLQQFFGPGFQ